MALRVNYNYQADFGHVNMLKNEQKLNTSLERLESGLRINSAKDDAAGLFIADQLNLVAKALEQGSRNANDGISAAQIAESTLGQIYDKLTTMYTKASQAANDTNDANARNALQQDILKLADAIQKISETTEFNGQKLLTGSFVGKTIHFGPRAEQTLSMSIQSSQTRHIGGLAEVQGTFITGDANAFSNSAPGTVGSGDSIEINGTDIMSWYRTEYGTEADAYNFAQVVNKYIDGVEAVATNKITGSAFNGTNFFEGTGLSGTTSGTVEESVDVTLDLAITGSKGSQTVSISKTLTDEDPNADLTIDEVINAINTATEKTGVVAKNDNGKIVLEDINGGNIKIKASGKLQNTAGYTNSGDESAKIHIEQLGLGIKKDTSNNELTVDASTTDESIDWHHGGIVQLLADDAFTFKGSSSSILTAFGLDSAYTTETTINPDTTKYNLDKIDVTTQKGAETAMKILNSAIKTVDKLRSSLGSIQQNLQTIIDNNDFSATQTREAESRIRNVDFAKEMAEFTKQQTLMQSGISMLAQAKQLPQMVLQLLR
ncbi:flagellin [Nitratiruptor sp. YY08-26]|uniref:flagellin N-terminal helical domain-containing protein n=1 Tax=unclassified Nitratiruptor TaxID=2624044 RepID=UPI0019169B53|nr:MULTISPECIES: flagellin [unclassified Nitratiruptor]BCD61880.1 flagellin [Nitratiruptor sp. YY08-13]BCD65815.1 flagellin [Nitratiruptor sp. YY08-26]